MVTTPVMIQFSYASVFGGGTIFLTGMYVASLRPLTGRSAARLYMTTGLLLFCAIAVFIHKSGGWQNPQGRFIHWFFLFMPEILAATFFLVVRDALTRVADPGREFGATAIPTLSRGLTSVGGAVFNAIAHFGRVSYSGYIFSLFTLNFTERVFRAIHPGSWLSMISAWFLYFLALTLFATVSFHAIELPFLRMRRRYVHSARESHGSGHGDAEDRDNAEQSIRRETASAER
jgi:hypothetical protein